MVTFCLVPLHAAVNGFAEDEEELDGNMNRVNVSTLDDICCPDAPVANSDGDSAFLVSPVRGVPPSDVSGKINSVGSKAAKPNAWFDVVVAGK